MAIELAWPPKYFVKAALGNPKILANVFSHFDSGFETEESHSARMHLYWASLTCRLFSAAAINELWRSMDSLVPLLKLLPSFSQLKDIYIFQRPLAPAESDWIRFRLYAERIECFTIRDNNHHRIAYGVYLHLARFCPFLPNLRRLVCHQPDISVLLFTSPNLREVEYGDGINDNLAWQSLISLAAPSGPKLTSIVFHMEPIGRSLDLLLHFITLRRLEIESPITRTRLKALTPLKDLEVLHVKLVESSAYDEDAKLGFPNLKELRLKGTFHDIRAILDRVTTQILESVTLVAICVRIQESVDETSNRYFFKVPHYKGWSGVSQTLNKRWSRSLTRISIALDESRRRFGQEFPPNMFSSLSPFERLEYLAVNNTHFHPTKDTIEQLAAVMPNVKELRLNTGDCVSGAPYSDEAGRPCQVSLKSLWTLAEILQQLRCLEIGIDIDTDIPALDHTRFTNHRLRHLIAGSGNTSSPRPIKVLRGVARYLLHIFPYPEDVQVSPDHDAGDWDTVAEFLRFSRDLFQAIPVGY